MGKALQTKFANLSHQIVKKAPKKEKRETGENLKRKAVHNRSDAEPPSKIQKLIADDGNKDTESDLPLLAVDKILSSTVLDEKIIIVDRSNSEAYLKIESDDKDDYFWEFELKNSHSTFYFDFHSHIIEEIALEGLDGITLEGFWERFQIAIEKPLEVHNHIQLLDIIWKIIVDNESFQIFELPEPRPALNIHYKCSDSFEKNTQKYAYPHKVVTDKDVQGSCSTFYERTEISDDVKKLTIKEVMEKYGSKLVIVANQPTRKAILYDDMTDPGLVLGNYPYCILERIGRSRKFGEPTFGTKSLFSSMDILSKNMFHHLKPMVAQYLLVRQSAAVRNSDNLNQTCGLFHLRRFYRREKSHVLQMAEKIVSVLKHLPGYRMPRSNLTKIFQSKSLIKLLRTHDANRFIKLDEFYPYRTVFPNAPQCEWAMKSSQIEKMIQCVELVDPNINISACWDNQPQQQEESDDDDDDMDDDDIRMDETEGKCYNVDLLREIYDYILQSGKKGLPVTELAKILGLSKRDLRSSFRRLCTLNLLSMCKLDRGRQKVMMYYAKLFDAVKPAVEEVPSNDVNTEVKMSKFKAKILEKQKAALEKLKTDTLPSNGLEISATDGYQRITHVDQCNIPKNKCEFLAEFHKITWKIFYDIQEDPIIELIREYSLQIKCYTTYDNICTINFNKLIAGLNPQTQIITPIQMNIDINDVITDKYNINLITKVILLRAYFDTLNIGAELTSNSSTSSRKRKLSNDDAVDETTSEQHQQQQQVKAMQRSYRMYMGDNPQLVLHEVHDNMVTEIFSATDPGVIKLDREFIVDDNKITPRTAKRIQMIIDAVNENNLFEDISKLYRVIILREEKEGYTDKIDRKSFFRILKRMVEAGYIKIYKVIIRSSDIMKSQELVCHPNVSPTDSLIQTVCEQMRFNIIPNQIAKQAPAIVPKCVDKTPFTLSPFKQLDVMDSVAELQKLIESGKMNSVIVPSNRRSARIYGYKPKFIRMRLLHEFMFFLIYNFTNQSQPLSKEKVRDLFRRHSIILTDEMLEEMPSIYCNEISWKMFIPPLPVHMGWPVGWALMCDIILRLPIFLFCRINFVGFDSVELKEMLLHPIKRYYLIKNLPPTVCSLILYKRRYMFNTSSTVTSLVFLGLVQYGPQKYRDKDQVFLYLNRRASLMDTTTSELGYDKVSVKEYRKLSFYFNSTSDLDNYWSEMCSIGLQTPLNHRTPGQIVVYTYHTANPSLLKAMESRTIEEAVANDRGEIPGNQRGAVGLDSSFWCHLQRNWCWKKKKTTTDVPAAIMGGLRDKFVKPKRMVNFQELGSAIKVSRSIFRRTIEIKPTTNISTRPTKTRIQICRKIQKIHFSKKMKKEPDGIDKAIIKRIGRARVHWNRKEDEILLLLKLGDMFFNQTKNNKQLISYHIMRDILHRFSPESKHKTSRACSRRLKTLMKKEQRTKNTLRVGIQRLMDYQPIQKLVSILKQKNTKDPNQMMTLRERQLIPPYMILMSYILNDENIRDCVLMKEKNRYIDHLKNDCLVDIENNHEESEKFPVVYVEPTTEDQIRKDVIKSTIMSSLNSKNKLDMAAQLYRIYIKYPDELIRETIAEMKRTHLISSFKGPVGIMRIIISIPLKISQQFIYLQCASHHTKTAFAAYEAIRNLIKSNEKLDYSPQLVNQKHYGQMLGHNEMLSFWTYNNLDFQFFLPHTSVILNPKISDHSELLDELAKRFQLKMEKLESERNNEQDNLLEMYESDRPPNQDDNDIEQSQHQQVEKVQESAAADKNPLDDTLAVDNADEEEVEEEDTTTIDRLKTWLTDCMDDVEKRERRSPSPEFVDKKMTATTTDTTTTVMSGSVNLEQPDTSMKTDSFQRNPDRKQRFVIAERAIPSIEEIKEEMMKESDPNEERRIPHITELSYLLHEPSELNTPDETLKRFRSHFKTRYAFLEKILIDDPQEFENFYMVDYLMSNTRNRKVWEKIRTNLMVKDISISLNLEAILMEEGDEDNNNFAREIVDFIKTKECIGATGQELKEQFQGRQSTLILIISILVKHGFLFRTGVCTLKFVYYKFRSPWLINTYILSDEEEKILSVNLEKAATQKTIETHFKTKQEIQAIVMPWTMVDGSLNKDLFKTWMCNVLSKCLDHPRIDFQTLCKSYRFIKPVDIYYLLEILQELGCVDMFVYDEEEMPSLFSHWNLPKEYPATILDNLENLFIETNNVSMTILGSFFHEISVEN